MRRNDQGVYYHPETREVLAVTDGSANPGEGWIKVSSDPALGLLAVRRKVEERGLVEDGTSVEWFGLRGASTDADEEISALICRFKRNSDESEKEAGSKGGLLDRLATRLKTVVGGPGNEAGHASSLAPVPIPVRSRDAQDPRISPRR